MFKRSSSTQSHSKTVYASLLLLISSYISLHLLFSSALHRTEYVTGTGLPLTVPFPLYQSFKTSGRVVLLCFTPRDVAKSVILFKCKYFVTNLITFKEGFW